MMLYPLHVKPIYKDYVWGGNQIQTLFNRKTPFPRVAESWEISDREEGMSFIENGPLAGKSLHDIFIHQKKELMGKDTHYKKFPLLIKLIDARENLSVQVHPSDATASATHGEAKSEAWVILKAKPKSTLYAGLKGPISKEQLHGERIIDLMQVHSAHAGDVINIPGGRLHAIGAGIVLFEVQQNSNTTYRVYDWGRGRPLHHKEAEKALLEGDIEDPHISPQILEENPRHRQTLLLSTPHFSIEKWEIFETIQWPKIPDQCEMLFCLEGKNSLVPVGRSCLLPASCPPITITTTRSTFFRTLLP
ncbi:MAG: class I mannose-6-phosphate isomerase [Chlamydiia bacterium]|nr:class I mannose-6-phosphate isomerase [Chlamydiia bacterium]